MFVRNNIPNVKCSFCDKTLILLPDGKPMSKYYTMDLSEMYCSARCSLNMYEEKKRNG